MKIVNLLGSLLLILLITVTCTGREDQNEISFNKEQINNSHRVISSVRTDGKYKVQVKEGSSIKVYDTLRYADGYIYNKEGILHEENYTSKKLAKTSRSSYRYLIDLEGYIHSGDGFVACPSTAFTRESPAGYDRWVIVNCEGYETDADCPIYYITADGDWVQGPIVVDPWDPGIRDYLECWADTDPTSVVSRFFN
ncbi:hypothetical protein BBI01_17690 [Chryseobacterium artocarpi]|uniref:Uncharacterized protein n=1 Tax=Chryseobacterium artocarpi TaxID=1414727 RepID=A0A1B8ZBV9_9FLAO|nr:hypothetical protein [Chryseobacterium artocarpi]OCA69044.1 hypothetical protein BBI01_17690 [Chryseobacterium artocarpi]